MGVYFLAAGSSSKNRDRTLDKGHSVEEISRCLSESNARLLASSFDDDEPVFLWGANSDAKIGRVQPGEYVVDVKNKVVVQVFSFCFSVLTNDTRLQEFVRWDHEKPRESRRPYQFVYFLKHPQRTKRTQKSYFQNAFQQHANQNWLVGQRYFDNGEVKRALERTRCVSVEDLLGLAPGPMPEMAGVVADSQESEVAISADEFRESSSSELEAGIETPDWLTALVQEIKALQQDPGHQERDHEDLVASLFVALDYKRIEDIKFRRGRVDIAISNGDEELITIEAKADWSLSASNKDYISQAFNYSLETGTRWVIVTNGDRYLLFDRDKGRTYDDGLVANFQLTSLVAGDLDVIESLRKGKL